jgi:hypothetical protein
MPTSPLDKKAAAIYNYLSVPTAIQTAQAFSPFHQTAN